MTNECNNISSCHAPEVIIETSEAIRVVCRHCNHQYVIRKDLRGTVENRTYSAIFRKEILQRWDNLFYKYYPHFIKK